MYIVFEGIVGTGKTTQSKMLAEYLRKTFSKKEVIWTREPGGSEIADAIRTLVQGTPFHEEMQPLCEAYLYAASRAQTLRSVVWPVLERGGIVIADRSFFSSIAWQGYGRGIGKEVVTRVNAEVIAQFMPDVVLYLSLDLDTARARTFDARGDKFEMLPEAFFRECERGYHDLEKDPGYVSLWETISAQGTKAEVFARIGETLVRRGLIPSFQNPLGS